MADKIVKQGYYEVRNLLNDAAKNDLKLSLDKRGNIKTASKLEQFGKWLSGLGRSTEWKADRELKNNIKIVQAFDRLLQRELTPAKDAGEFNNRTITILKAPSRDDAPLSLKATIDLYDLANANPQSNFSKAYFKHFDAIAIQLAEQETHPDLQEILNDLQSSDPERAQTAKSCLADLSRVIGDRAEQVKTQFAGIPDHVYPALQAYQRVKDHISQLAAPHIKSYQAGFKNDTILRDVNFSQSLTELFGDLKSKKDPWSRDEFCKKIDSIAKNIGSYEKEVINGERGSEFKKDLTSLFNQIYELNTSASKLDLSKEQIRSLFNLESTLFKMHSVDGGSLNPVNPAHYIEARQFALGLTNSISHSSIKSLTEDHILRKQNVSKEVKTTLQRTSERIRDNLIQSEGKNLKDIGGVINQQGSIDFVKGLFKLSYDQLNEQVSTNQDLSLLSEILSYRQALEALHGQYPNELVRFEGESIYKPLSIVQINRPKPAADYLLQTLSGALNEGKEFKLLDQILTPFQNPFSETFSASELGPLNSLLIHAALARREIVGDEDYRGQNGQLDQTVYLLDKKVDALILELKSGLPQSEEKIGQLLELQVESLSISCPNLSRDDLTKLKQFELGISKTIPADSLQKLKDTQGIGQANRILKPIERAVEKQMFELLSKEGADFVIQTFAPKAKAQGQTPEQAASKFLQGFMRQYLAENILNPISQLKPRNLNTLTIHPEDLERVQLLNQSIQTLNEADFAVVGNLRNTNLELESAHQAIEYAIGALQVLPKTTGANSVEQVTKQLIALDGNILSTRNLNKNQMLDPQAFAQLSSYALGVEKNIPFLALENIANYRLGTIDPIVNGLYNASIKLIRDQILNKDYSLTQQINNQISDQFEAGLTPDHAKAIIYAALTVRGTEANRLDNPFLQESSALDQIQTAAALKLIETYKDSLSVVNLPASNLIGIVQTQLADEARATEEKKLAAERSEAAAKSDYEVVQAQLNRQIVVNQQKDRVNELRLNPIDISNEALAQSDLEVSLREEVGDFLTAEEISLDFVGNFRQPGQVLTADEFAQGLRITDPKEILARMEPVTQAKAPKLHPLESNAKLHYANLMHVSSLSFTDLSKAIMDRSGYATEAAGFAELLKIAKSINTQYQSVLQDGVAAKSAADIADKDEFVIRLDTYAYDFGAQIDRLASTDAALQMLFSPGLLKSDLIAARKFQLNFSKAAGQDANIPFGELSNIQKALETNPNPHTKDMLDAITDQIIDRYANNYRQFEIAAVQPIMTDGKTTPAESAEIIYQLLDRRLSDLGNKGSAANAREIDQHVLIRESILWNRLQAIHNAKVS